MWKFRTKENISSYDTYENCMREVRDKIDGYVRKIDSWHKRFVFDELCDQIIDKEKISEIRQEAKLLEATAEETRQHPLLSDIMPIMSQEYEVRKNKIKKNVMANIQEFLDKQRIEIKEAETVILSSPFLKSIAESRREIIYPFVTREGNTSAYQTVNVSDIKESFTRKGVNIFVMGERWSGKSAIISRMIGELVSGVHSIFDRNKFNGTTAIDWEVGHETKIYEIPGYDEGKWETKEDKSGETKFNRFIEMCCNGCDIGIIVLTWGDIGLYSSVYEKLLMQGRPCVFVLNKSDFLRIDSLNDKKIIENLKQMKSIIEKTIWKESLIRTERDLSVIGEIPMFATFCVDVRSIGTRGTDFSESYKKLIEADHNNHPDEISALIDYIKEILKKNPSTVLKQRLAYNACRLSTSKEELIQKLYGEFFNNFDKEVSMEVEKNSLVDTLHKIDENFLSSQIVNVFINKISEGYKKAFDSDFDLDLSNFAYEAIRDMMEAHFKKTFIEYQEKRLSDIVDDLACCGILLRVYVQIRPDDLDIIRLNILEKHAVFFKEPWLSVIESLYFVKKEDRGLSLTDILKRAIETKNKKIIKEKVVKKLNRMLDIVVAAESTYQQLLEAVSYDGDKKDANEIKEVSDKYTSLIEHAVNVMDIEGELRKICLELLELDKILIRINNKTRKNGKRIISRCGFSFLEDLVFDYRGRKFLAQSYNAIKTVDQVKMWNASTSIINKAIIFLQGLNIENIVRESGVIKYTINEVDIISRRKLIYYRQKEKVFDERVSKEIIGDTYLLTQGKEIVVRNLDSVLCEAFAYRIGKILDGEENEYLEAVYEMKKVESLSCQFEQILPYVESDKGKENLVQESEVEISDNNVMSVDNTIFYEPNITYIQESREKPDVTQQQEVGYGVDTKKRRVNLLIELYACNGLGILSSLCCVGIAYIAFRFDPRILLLINIIGLTLFVGNSVTASIHISSAATNNAKICRITSIERSNKDHTFHPSMSISERELDREFEERSSVIDPCYGQQEESSGQVAVKKDEPICANIKIGSDMTLSTQ